MPTLPVIIDARKAKQGRDEFGRYTKAMISDAEKVTASVKNMFLPLAGGIAGAAGLKSAFEKVANFEQVLAEIKGVTGATASEFNALETAARGLGATTQFSATQAAQSLLNLSKAGLSVKESISASNGVLALAQAHGLDLARSSEIVIAAMKSFGLTSADTTRIIDSFSSVANLSSSDVEDLAMALQQVGPFANSLGLEIEDVNASLGVLSNVSIKGMRGGTALRAILESLINPTSLARDAFKRLKVSVEELDPRTHSMTEIFTRLRSAGMDAKDAVKIFGVEAASASLELAKSAETIDEYVTKQKEMTGSTEDLAKTMTETPWGAIGNFLSAVEEVVIAIGRDSGLSALFVTLTNFITDVMLVAFTKFGDTVEDASGWVHTLANTLKGVLAATVVRLVVPAIELLVATLGKVRFAIKAITVALASNPFGAALTAVSLLVGALVYFKDTLVSVGDKTFSISDLLTAMFEHAVKQMKFVSGVLYDLWDQVIHPVLKKGLDYVIQVFNDIGALITLFFGMLGTDWRSAFKGAANFAIASFMAMWNAFSVIFKRITDSVNVLANTDWTSPMSVGFAALQLSAIADAEDIGIEIASSMAGAFQTDWVDKIGKAVSLGLSAAEAAWKAFTATEFGATINRLYNPVEVFKSITERADELRRLREASKNATEKDTEKEHQHTEAIIPAADATAKLTEEEEKLQQLREEGYAQLTQRIADLTTERSLLSMTTAEQERFNMVAEATAIAREHQIEDASEYISKMEEELRLLQQAKSERWFEDYLRSIKEEQDVMFMSNEQREIAVRLREAEAFALDHAVVGADKYLDKLKSEMELLQRMRALKDMADDMGDSFADALLEFTQGAKTAAEAARDLGMEIYKAFLQAAIAKPIAQAASNVFAGIFAPAFGVTAAHGQAFGDGRVIPMASGGALVDRPSLFGMDGASVLAGEAGPEAIMPLKRLPNGKLGIETDGARGGATTITINFNGVTDMDGFRKNRSQILRGIAGAIDRSRKNG